MRDGQRIAVIGSVFAVLVGAAGFGAYALIGDGDESGTGQDEKVLSADTKPKAAPAVTGPPSAEEVVQTSQRFLKAWETGNAARAASWTDDRSAALKALSTFQKKAALSKLTLTAGTRSGSTMPFTVNATVSYGDEQSVPWTYKSALTAVREKETGKVVVDWKPAVLYPRLKAGESIATGPYGTPPVKALDRDGEPLTAADHPTLSAMITDLAKRFATKGGGKQATGVHIVDAKGEAATTPLLKLGKARSGTVRTTIDAGLQRTAEKAIAGKTKAAVAAVKPSTGEILAVANTPAKGFNTATQGAYAPGSTMKIITSALLIEKGLASSGREHPCPKYFTYGGWKFQNDKKFEIENGTFSQSFARSCNTAFISQAPKLTDSDLTKQARDVFGVGLNWQTGMATFDGQVPVQSDAQMAASLIGQGAVRMNPLVMASVSATVKSGTFRQPYIVSPSVDNRSLAKAPRGLSPAIAGELRGLMRLTATSGTAAEAMAGLSGDIGAKTGSAEVGGQTKPNAWFTAYRNDLAVSALVPNTGHGGEFAGPVVRQVLAAGG